MLFQFSGKRISGGVVACAGALVAITIGAGESRAQDPTLPVPDEIRAEVIRPEGSPIGRPLPVAAQWNVGESGNHDGFDPDYFLKLIADGHYVLPGFGHPNGDKWLASTWKPGAPERDKWIKGAMAAYEPAIKEAARLHLPLVFLATQWESVITEDKKYKDVPAEANPCVVGPDGKVRAEVSPFGPVDIWHDAGIGWTNGMFMKQFQEWYPDPPRVIFISNNENGKLAWTDAESDLHYLVHYGRGHDDEFKRKVVADGYIERYRALQSGLRDGLVNQTWKRNAIFVGYDAFGPPHFGRHMSPETWKEYSLYNKGRIDPYPLMWDGASPSYYINNWQANTDYTVWSPEVETMNWVFMLDEAYKLNPNFFFELSTWDGDQPGAPNGKREWYVRQGQSFTHERYGGFIQYGMWLTRPHVVRDFRGWLESVEYAGPYFMPIVQDVDRVHNNSILREFWRTGQLVPNRAHQHPYQVDIPDEYKAVDRWYALDTNLDPPRPWTLHTELPVYSLALVKGAAPHREWLVYAFAPVRARPNVQITVPEFGPITVDTYQTGAFYLVSEATKKATTVVPGGPASVAIGTPSQFVEPGQAVSFTAKDAASPAGWQAPFTWDFGDGATAQGEQISHIYATPGQYLVQLTGTDRAGAVVKQNLSVFVGMEPDEDLVLRYNMVRPPDTSLLQWQWLGGWNKLVYHFIADSSNHKNLGFVNADTWVDDPAHGTVLQLDGKSTNIYVLNDPSLNTAGPYPSRTVQLWFKATDLAKRQVIFEEGAPGNGLNIYLDGGLLHAGAWATVSWPGTWLSSDKLQANQWYHVALVLRDAGAKPTSDALELYMDGAKIASGSAAQLPAHGNIVFGYNQGTRLSNVAQENSSDYFSGSLGKVEIYNRPLSPEEIADNARQ